MKIKYEFVNGESVEVEVTEELGKIIVDMDRIEYNNEKKETRRHCTLSTLGDEGKWLIDPNSDFTTECCKYPLGLDEETWQYALKILSKRQREIFVAVYEEGYKVKEYAEMIGLSPSCASGHLFRARKKIKDFFGSC